MTEITYKTILEARAKGASALHEASLGRVFQHVQKMDEKSWGILSAHRGEFRGTPAVNNKRDAALQAQVRQLGHGFFRLFGVWSECQDPSLPYKECPEDKKIEVREPSLFVPGLSLARLKQLLVKYEQDAGIYGGPETKGKVWLVFKDGGHEDLGSFSPSKIGAAYSRLKGGRTFVFEWGCQGYIDRVIEENWNKTNGAKPTIAQELRRLSSGALVP